METKRFEFISYPYNCEYGSSPNATVTYTIHERDVKLDEMRDAFEQFLRGAGYVIPFEEEWRRVKKIKLRGGDEYDVHTNWRKVAQPSPSTVKQAKKTYNKRFRKESRNQISKEAE